MNKPKVGDKVHYQPKHFEGDDSFENGIVKETRENVDDAVWVVYNCAGEWDNYRNYTAAKTNLWDLKEGWRT